MRRRPNDEAKAESYRNDPAFAFEVLKDVVQDGDLAELRIVLRQMAQFFGRSPPASDAHC